MTRLYLKEQGANVGVTGGRLVIKKKGKLLQDLPKNTVESLVIFGDVSMTTPCIRFLLDNNVPTVLLGTNGKFFGKLDGLAYEHRIDLLSAQMKLCTNDVECLNFSKKITEAKVKNQRVVLGRYSNSLLDQEIRDLKILLKQIPQAVSVSELMGIEGISAKYYFSALSKIMPNEFAFQGRNKNPPTDPFNALISFGYSLVANEIRAYLELLGLNPYLSFMHKKSTRYPALVYDMIEEWRPIISDSLALSLIMGHELHKDDFFFTDSGIFLTGEGMKKYLNKYEQKMNKAVKYIKKTDQELLMRDYVFEQCLSLKEGIRLLDMDSYQPVLIR